MDLTKWLPAGSDCGGYSGCHRDFFGTEYQQAAFCAVRSGRKEVKLWKISSFSRLSRSFLPCPAGICTRRRNEAPGVSAVPAAVPATGKPAAANAVSQKDPPLASKGKAVSPDVKIWERQPYSFPSQRKQVNVRALHLMILPGKPLKALID